MDTEPCVQCICLLCTPAITLILSLTCLTLFSILAFLRLPISSISHSHAVADGASTMPRVNSAPVYERSKSDVEGAILFTFPSHTSTYCSQVDTHSHFSKKMTKHRHRCCLPSSSRSQRPVRQSAMRRRQDRERSVGFDSKFVMRTFFYRKPIWVCFSASTCRPYSTSSALSCFCACSGLLAVLALGKRSVLCSHVALRLV